MQVRLKSLNPFEEETDPTAAVVEEDELVWLRLRGRKKYEVTFDLLDEDGEQIPPVVATIQGVWVSRANGRVRHKGFPGNFRCSRTFFLEDVHPGEYSFVITGRVAIPASARQLEVRLRGVG